MPNGWANSIAAWLIIRRISRAAPKRAHNEPHGTDCGAANPGCRRLSAGVYVSEDLRGDAKRPPERRPQAVLPAPLSMQVALVNKTEPLFAELSVAAAVPLRPGFRLQRVEVLNWGTFHKQVWGLDLGGNNALLTGDIGSGKSTFVDAVTALLVPRANFNKAAGAATDERRLET